MENKEVNIERWDLNKEHINLQSRYEIGEVVSLDFYNSKFLIGVLIHAIYFTESKVYYDIKVPVGFDEDYTIIRKIDSCFVIDYKL